MLTKFENLEEITRLEREVKYDLECLAPFSPKEREIAWSLAQKLKEHHIPTYVDSLKVALKTKEILVFTNFLPRTGLYGGLLHDIGKLETPIEILNKTYGVGEKYTA